MNPWRAALTSATASGNSTRIASRIAIDCSSAPPVDLNLRERSRGQLDRGVQGQRRELLALRLLHRLGLLLGELAQSAQQILGIAAEREASESTFHAAKLAQRRPGSRARRRARTPPRCRSPPGSPPRTGDDSLAERPLERDASPRRPRRDSAAWRRAAARRSPARARAPPPPPPRCPGGCSTIRTCASCDAQLSRSPPPARSPASSHSATIDAVSRTSSRRSTGRTVVVEHEPAPLVVRPERDEVETPPARRLGGEHARHLAVRRRGAGDPLQVLAAAP